MSAIFAKIDECARVCEACSQKGWAEANAGNISFLIDRNDMDISDVISPWVLLPETFPSLANRYVLLSASGSIFRNAMLDKERSFGVVELNSDGSAYRNVWGFSENGKPSSEWLSHLGILSVRVEVLAVERVVLHAHTPYLVALCNILKLDTASLTRLIWEMHGEGIMFLPDGVGFMPFEVSGSPELYVKTREMFKSRRAVLWEYHGAVATGVDPSSTLGIIEVCEKAAFNYCTVMQSGGFTGKLSKLQLQKIADKFGLSPDIRAMSI